MPLWLTYTSSGPLSQALLHHRSMTSNSTHSLPSALLRDKSCLFCSSLWPLGIWLWYWGFKSFFSEDYLRQKDGSKKEETEAYVLCWLHAKSWDISLQRPASVCVVVSKLSANCRATTWIHKAHEAPGPAQWSGLWPWLCQFFGDDGAGFQKRVGVLLCKFLPASMW